jgi:hypothetical protein
MLINITGRKRSQFRLAESSQYQQSIFKVAAKEICVFCRRFATLVHKSPKWTDFDDLDYLSKFNRPVIWRLVNDLNLTVEVFHRVAVSSKAKSCSPVCTAILQIQPSIQLLFIRPLRQVSFVPQILLDKQLHTHG